MKWVSSELLVIYSDMIKDCTNDTSLSLEALIAGNVIITDLGAQRETLERTRARLGEAGEDLSRSRRVLRRMYTGVVSNKIILIVIILVEIGILAGVTYWKYIKK